MVLRLRFFGEFLGPALPASHVQYISDLHSKFALGPHHVSKYGRHPFCDRWDCARKNEERKKETRQKYNVLICYAGRLLRREREIGFRQTCTNRDDIALRLWKETEAKSHKDDPREKWIDLGGSIEHHLKTKRKREPGPRHANVLGNGILIEREPVQR